MFSAIRKQQLQEEKIKEEIKKLLENGANIDAQNKQSNTILHIAVKKNYKKIVEFLLQKGAKINVKNGKGETPLGLAKNNQNLDLAKILVKSINVPADGNCLFWAVTLAYLTPAKSTSLNNFPKVW